MRIKDLYEIDWKALTIDDLVKAHDLMGMDFEFNNGELTRVFIDKEKIMRG